MCPWSPVVGSPQPEAAPDARCGTLAYSAVIKQGVARCRRRSGTRTSPSVRGYYGRLSRCSVVSPSSTAERPRCGSSTPSGISTPRPGRRIETVALYTDAERTATFVREADIAYSLGPASARPYLDHAVLERALVRDRRRRRLGRLGLRRRGPGVRRAVREDRRHLHRPERRGDAQARRQDRLEADRRGGRRPGRAVEPRRGRRPSTTRCARGERDRLPADAQGDRRRRRARHPDGRLRRGPRPTPTSAPARRRCARSAPAWCSWSAWSPAPGTSRSRSSPTGRAPRGRWACATARCSGATRRSSRSPPRRC